MPQSIAIQVGQCGNQIGARFWDKVYQEHSKYNKLVLYDEPTSTFFRNVDISKGCASLGVGNGSSKIVDLRARGIMVDMEEGVINQIKNSPLNKIFDERQIVYSNSGSGNNWAVGYKTYGTEYHEVLLDSIRKEAEYCDSLQSFFMISSLGGGTGSGLGSYICEMLSDEFPEVYRFSNVICPSANDDVVTSPYNSILSLSKLIDYSDCIIPIENQALQDIHNKIVQQADGASKRKLAGSLTDNFDKNSSDRGLKLKPKPFDTMNNIVANLLLNLTSSMRFGGTMNVDINDITTNLVPFPKLKYLVSSMTPLYTLGDLRVSHRGIDQMFIDAFSRDSQLIKADPKASKYLACALIVRGSVEISDIRRNIDRMMSTLNFVEWNQEGWKTGLCSTPPVNQTHSLLTLANNCCIKQTFGVMEKRFMKLYKRRANLHHYTNIIEKSDFDTSIENVRDLIEEYNKL